MKKQRKKQKKKLNISSNWLWVEYWIQIQYFCAVYFVSLFWIVSIFDKSLYISIGLRCMTVHISIFICGNGNFVSEFILLMFQHTFCVAQAVSFSVFAMWRPINFIRTHTNLQWSNECRHTHKNSIWKMRKRREKKYETHN